MGYGSLTATQRSQVEDIFELLDGNSDGKIGASECTFALRSCIGDVNETDVRDFIQLVCTGALESPLSFPTPFSTFVFHSFSLLADGSGEIGLVDFVQMLVSMESANPKVANLTTLAIVTLT